jgi:hypothetical protein
MFIFSEWDAFCAQVKSCPQLPLRAKDVLHGAADHQPFLILKHDVETDASKSLALARIENKHGLCGSYYVQGYLLDNPRAVSMLQEIKSLGHEVSYHYDVLDANHGDFPNAISEFKDYLGRFGSLGFEIETVCQHGNPVMVRNGYNSNRDFFRNAEVRALYPQMFDVVVNFRDRIGIDFLYVSDVGYGWKLIDDIERNDLPGCSRETPLGGPADIVARLKQGGSMIVSVHPHRWQSGSLAAFCRIASFRAAKRTAVLLTRVPILKRVLSKFFYLAKHI